MEYEYTVITLKGDVDLTTENHHSSYHSIEDFFKDHKTTIDTALGVSGQLIQCVGLHLLHGKRGAKIK